MSCCCPQNLATGKFFSRFARRYHKRYLKKGLEKTQQQLVAGVQQAGVAGASLLEIGCGVGYLHQFLLQHGASQAVGIDLSARMIEEARALAAEQNLSERTAYRQGDFVDLAAEVDAADVSLLDKVVCCYPDAESLVKKSTALTRRVYALTYPRDRRITRWGSRLMAAVFWLLRSPMRNYVHDPRVIEDWIIAAGFRKQSESTNFLWLTQIYTRP
ncbi:MAG: methyltransferase domain-containing protein [Gammaproteobacteria bacterium]|nr:methyltransferase domain-containing protein [Gammaproteobacteria bacterium]